MTPTRSYSSSPRRSASPPALAPLAAARAEARRLAKRVADIEGAVVAAVALAESGATRHAVELLRSAVTCPPRRPPVQARRRSA